MMEFRFSENGQENWVECFKVGTHTDMNGREYNWTEPVLEKIVNNFNEGSTVAPVQESHSQNMPAKAFIDKLKLVGTKMYARVIKPLKEFKEAVQKGEYRGVSIGLSPSLGFNHLAFLKDQNPAIKGLAYPMLYAENDNWGKLLVGLNQKFSQDTADKVFGIAKMYFSSKLNDSMLNEKAVEFTQQIYKTLDVEVASGAVTTVFYFLGIGITKDPNATDAGAKLGGYRYVYKEGASFQEHLDVQARRQALKDIVEERNKRRR